MATEYKIEADGSLTIMTRIKPEGSMLEQEEQIAAAVAEVGRIATVFYNLYNRTMDSILETV